LSGCGAGWIRYAPRAKICAVHYKENSRPENRRLRHTSAHFDAGQCPAREKSVFSARSKACSGAGPLISPFTAACPFLPLDLPEDLPHRIAVVPPCDRAPCRVRHVTVPVTAMASYWSTAIAGITMKKGPYGPF
jgi:hypothetical protein